jgi:hypothetical protein
MRSAIRDAAAACVTAVAIAIAVDVVLQFLTAAMRISGGITPPWWGRAAAHSVWIVLAAFVWLAAPFITTALEPLVPNRAVSRRTIWALVGTALVALPPLHVIAQLAVLAVQLTLSGTWGSESRIFISGAYYGAVMLAMTPWMAAGVILRAWAAHLIDLP